MEETINQKIGHALIRAMIPHVKYSTSELAMAREASDVQSDNAKTVLVLLMESNFFDQDMAEHVRAAIGEYFNDAET